MRRKTSFSLRTLYPGLRRQFRRDLLRSYASSAPPPTGGNNGRSRLNLVCPCVAKAPMEFTTYPKPRGGSSSSSKSTSSTNNKGPVIRCTNKNDTGQGTFVDGNAQQLWNAPTSASSVRNVKDVRVDISTAAVRCTITSEHASDVGLLALKCLIVSAITSSDRLKLRRC